MTTNNKFILKQDALGMNSVARKAREKNESEIYHIMMKEINRRTIFEDDEDCVKFIQTLKRYKEKSGYQV